MCFFSPIRNDPKKTHKQLFGTHPVPGQSRKFVYVYVFFLSLNILGKTKTLQTVTLRVAILSDFSARRLSQNFGAKLKQKSAQVLAVFSWKFAGTE